VALLRAAKAIDRMQDVDGDEKVGAMIIKRALEAPMRQIVENAGMEASVIVEKVKLITRVNEGYDAETLTYVNMLEAGIIDPTKVTRVALQHAASIASLLLTTEALISDVPDTAKAGQAQMPHGGDMY
jgi:chaperonin GroEL